jgi:hypothetical protein
MTCSKLIVGATTRANQPAIATPAPTREANSVHVATKQNYARGRVNHVAVEEVQEVLDIVIGMFLINDTSAVLVFDFGASHSFISVAYIGKHNLPVDLLRCQMIVSSLGRDMPTRQLCPKVNLKIRGQTLSPTSLSWNQRALMSFLEWTG